MGEILSRGRNSKYGGWAYGAYIRHETRQLCVMGGDELKPDEVKHYIVRDGFADWNMPKTMELVEVNPKTVGLKVPGLTDKNKNWLFDGDLVRLDIDASVREIVFIEDNEWAWMLMDANIAIEHIFEYTRNDILQAEIIGNIHDNPELLEVADHA